MRRGRPVDDPPRSGWRRLGALGEERLRNALAEEWALVGVHVEALGGGMNSRTWAVRRPGAVEERWVAKAVPAAQEDSFVLGLSAAVAVGAAGVVTGAPVTAAGRSLRVGVDGCCLALLSWVDGAALSGTAAEQPGMGETLAAAHVALRRLPAVEWTVPPTAPVS